jgi:hypothetical protein
VDPEKPIERAPKEIVQREPTFRFYEGELDA